jgi:hypothetical protein
VLAELDGIGHAIANDWMEYCVGFDQLALHLLKHIGLSATRLDALVDEGVTLNIDEIRKEITTYCTLVAALRCEE